MHVLAIPIQALTVRTKGDLDPAKKSRTQCKPHRDPVAEKAQKEELQGVFVVRDGKARVRHGGHRDHGRDRHRSAERA